MPGRSSSGCSPQPLPPTTASDRTRVVEQCERVDEGAEILAGLERRHREQVRPVAFRDGPVHTELRTHPRMGDQHPLPREAGRVREVVRGERRVGEDDVHVAAAFRYLRRVHRAASRPVVHSGWWTGTRSWIVVARTPARWGGYIQSLKCNALERAEPPLGRRVSDHRPRGAPRVRERERHEPQLDVDPGERLRDDALPGGRGRRERDDVVTVLGRDLGEAAERAADVVVHPGSLVGQRADVEGDSHRGGE